MRQPNAFTADKERLKCPHCDSHLTTRSSRPVTPFYRQKTLQCRNVECGATYGGDSGITHQISPSACPRKGIQLRTASPRTQRSVETPIPQLHLPGIGPRNVT